jgi:rubrerythrin
MGPNDKTRSDIASLLKAEQKHNSLFDNLFGNHSLKFNADETPGFPDTHSNERNDFQNAAEIISSQSPSRK